ncbi:hypothetical protein CYMTET_21059 [Cymbomonas tetramitiformis]|uniref:Uncharacterized protein n=1 Tax=Cymbomonas tetramitiformis TaxID=36881 RepID=A0AAE0G3C4_9CHLO|nr:hypothetical protein CYMTET_21059 [Cymbomonas tetramitiformis]
MGVAGGPFLITAPSDTAVIPPPDAKTTRTSVRTYLFLRACLEAPPPPPRPAYLKVLLVCAAANVASVKLPRSSVVSGSHAPRLKGSEAGGTYRQNKGIPVQVYCPSGSSIKLPKFQDQSPGKVATRMLMNGSTTASVAIGGMDPPLAAAALGSGVLSVTKIGKILVHTKVEFAYQVLKRLPPSLQGDVLRELPLNTAGAIVSQVPVKDQEPLLLGLGFSTAVATNIAYAAASFIKCRNLMRQEEFKPWRCTHAVLDLDPVVGARLLAASSCSRSSVVLNNASSLNLKNAADRMEVLGQMASDINVLATNYKKADIILARLLNELKNVESQPQLVICLRNCMLHLLAGYGLRMTFTRINQDEPEEETSPAPQERAEKPVDQEDKSGPEVLPAEPSESELGEAEEREDRTEEAQEQAAEDSLDILCSTEDIRWGTMASPQPDGAEVGLVTQINARLLAQNQEEAVQHGDLYFKGAMMTIPVFSHTGSRENLGCLSYVIKRRAHKYLLGGFPVPKQNYVPKAIKSMHVLAAGISLAHENISRALEANPVEMDSKEVKDTGRVEAMRMMTQIKTMKAAMIKKIGKNPKIMTQQLQEIKNYTKPPDIVIRVLTALFILLSTEGFEAHLGSALKKFPADPKKLWAFTKSHIQLSQRHPNNFLRRLKEASKEHGHGKKDAQQCQRIMDAALTLLDPVERSECERASKVSSLLLDWIQIAIKELQLDGKLAETDSSTMDLSAVSAKKSGSRRSSIRRSSTYGGGEKRGAQPHFAAVGSAAAATTASNSSQQH